jgi:hypothetical protein
MKVVTWRVHLRRSEGELYIREYKSAMSAEAIGIILKALEEVTPQI